MTATLRDVRAQCIAEAYDLPLDEVCGKLTDEIAGLQRAEDDERLVLWFEHDL